MQVSPVCPRAAMSDFFALVTNLQFELKSFERHQASIEFLPGYFLTIYDEEPRVCISFSVPIYEAAHHPRLSELKA